MEKFDFLVVLVNWRRVDDTIACLESLYTNSSGFAVAVCENGSGDDSAGKLLAYFERRFGAAIGTISKGSRDFVFHDCDGRVCALLYQGEVNAGFAGGNNAAFNAASQWFDCDFVWFLNNDTEITASTASLLVDRMRSDSSIGICGATIVYAHDRLTVQALGGARYQPWSGLVSEVGQGSQWPSVIVEADIERVLSYVSGASMFVSRRFLDSVGLMNEDYFLYYEELDWARRAIAKGFRLGYVKDSVVYHKEGASLGSGRSARRSAISEFYGVRNRLRVTWRFFPFFILSVYMVSWIQVVKRMLQGHYSRAFLMARVLLGIQRSIG